MGHGLKEEGGQNDDYSVGTTWLWHENKYYLIDVMRGRFDYPTLKSRAILYAKVHKPTKILIEETQASALRSLPS